MRQRELSGDRQAKVNQGDAVDFDVKHEVPKTAKRGIFSFSF
jgi:hypothetical protein